MNTCTPCEVAVREGWWADSIPKGSTHCSDCHQTWPGSQRFGECSRCHTIFSGIESFDLHQKVDDEGQIADDCLCSALFRAVGSGKEPDLEEYRVRPSKTLFRRSAPWGVYWGGERLDPAVFA